MALAKNIYIFLSDNNSQYYTATQNALGDFAVTFSPNPVPIVDSPPNLLKTKTEFGTNKKYFSMARSINYPLEFIGDGAAILRYFYYKDKGINADLYITIVEINSAGTKYELSYFGKLDLSQKDELLNEGKFVAPVLDDSAWAVLMNNSDVEYAIECNATNPKAIRVLLDGMNLKNVFTYQTVQNTITVSANDFRVLPLLLINQEGDSYGLVYKDQPNRLVNTTTVSGSMYAFLKEYLLLNLVGTINTVVDGSIEFVVTQTASGPSERVYFRILKLNENSTINTVYTIIDLQTGTADPITLNQVYSPKFSFNITLNQNESLYYDFDTNSSGPFTIQIITKNIRVTTITRSEPILAWGLRAGDLMNQLVNQATNGRFGMDSNFFAANNKTILLSGDSVRQVANAKIYTNFDDFAETFFNKDALAFRSINDDLWMEKAYTDIYAPTGVIIDLGEAISAKLEPATEFYVNQIEVGSPTKDSNHPSGKLDFNATNVFSVDNKSVKRKMSLVTKYVFSPYELQFLIMDYVNGSTTDDSGDKTIYGVDITNNTAAGHEDVENFEIFTVNSATLEPIIKSPLNNDIINYQYPVIKGIAPPSTQVFIFVDNVLDGSTISGTDGNWSYNIANPLTSYILNLRTGIHIIDATFSDNNAPKSTISIKIDTGFSINGTTITYPTDLETLYNNLPLIKGKGNTGNVITILLDGTNIGSDIVDESNNWEFKFTTPITIGSHTIEADGYIINIEVFDNTKILYPIITYIGSELDGFPVLNNLPLIEGVAAPGAHVDLWLNYISYISLGLATADANGNWSFQVAPKTYPDPVSGLPVTLAPIQNGQNIISTDLVINYVRISQYGYELNRPLFSVIEGVLDNTVFNTMFSPKRMFENHYPMASAMLDKDRQNKIYFQKPGKNGLLRTVLNGVVVDEDADILYSELGSPFAILEYLTVRVKSYKTFMKALIDFKNGGVIKVLVKGTAIYMLCIGGMKMSSFASDVQEWKGLLAPTNSYDTLLGLYKNGLKVTLMQDTIWHSDYNTLHMVTYDFQRNSKYHSISMYDDWFTERNEFWANNPDYIEKLQRTESFKDQLIVNGNMDCYLEIRRCKDGIRIANIPYVPVVPNLLTGNEVVVEAPVNLASYPEDTYFFVIACYTYTIATSGSAITIPFQGNVYPYRRVFTLGGTVNTGDYFTIENVIDGVTYITNVTVQAGWDLTVTINNIITALQAQLPNTVSVYLGTYFGDTAIFTETISTSSVISGNVSIVHRTFTYSTIPIYATISERIQTKDVWPKTILLESSHTSNMVGAFFSTGFKTVVRVSGIVEKLQPDIDIVTSKDDVGSTRMLNSVMNKKRRIRFGSPRGEPDYIYLKIASGMTLDNSFVDNVAYTLSEKEKIEPSDDYKGHPLYYYEVNVDLKENSKGAMFMVGAGSSTTGGTIVVDAEAFGGIAGNNIQIQLP